MNREEPGGDADDPHEAALDRLSKEAWGWRNDKQDAVHVPVPDWKNWRRIRYFGVPTFVGFRYGDDHHAVIAIWVRDADEGTTPEQCLDKFEKWAEPTAHSFNVKMADPIVTRSPWGPHPGPEPPTSAPPESAAAGGSPSAPAASPSAYHPEVVVKSVDAEVSTLFTKTKYAAAYAGYVMWPRTCTIFGMAVPVRDSLELARQVRDRYVTDGFWRVERRAETVPSF